MKEKENHENPAGHGMAWDHDSVRPEDRYARLDARLAALKRAEKSPSGKTEN